MSTEAVDHPLPLTPLQHGMLFHFVQHGRGTGVDLEQLEALLPEAMDPSRFAAAWQTVATRHSALRTRFRWEHGGVPGQEHVAEMDVEFDFHDLSQQPLDDQTTSLSNFLTHDRTAGFDLSVAPMWRVALFRFGPLHHKMIWTYSHAILDACYAEVLAEVFAVYEAPSHDATTPIEPRTSYALYLRWLTEHIGNTSVAASAFWRDQLAGFDSPTRLLGAERQPALADDGTAHATFKFALDRDVSDAIHELTAKHDLRVSVFIEAAWALTLAAFSGSDDVAFGATRACRRSSIDGAERIIGLLINTVPVRVLLSRGHAVIELLRKLRAFQLAVRTFEHTPLIDSIACADAARGTALFDSIIVFNERDDDARLKAIGGAFARRSFQLHDQTSFPFNVMAYGEPCIHFKFSYARARYASDDIARVADLFSRILESMAAGVEAPVSALPRLPRADEQRLAALNDTRRDFEPTLVHQAFEAQCDRTPDETALLFRASSLTYRELEVRANGVAAALREEGIGRGALVGIYVERSLEMVIGLLGILKAGAAYVPLDPAYPAERIAMMLEDAGTQVVLTLERLRKQLSTAVPQILALDSLTASPLRPQTEVQPDDLAYVIFTSGSTGRPKGVQLSHRNVANFFVGMDAILGTKPGTWLALTSISFDISVLEIFWTLARGFRVVIQEDQRRVGDSDARLRLMRRMGFSLFYFAADADESTRNRYQLLLEGARFADDHGFDAVWTPERHFHPFGGLYPNPAVTSAAIAAVTQRISIRAGSVVLPLHNPIRCAEDWSIVDNLSNGRVGLSFASGWHASDFALAPEKFVDRRTRLMHDIETVRALWRGEKVDAISGDGTPISVGIYPRPVQLEPPIWITASGSGDTFAAAGRIGASVLTNLLVMTVEELRANINVYRTAYKKAGHRGDGNVSLMLHTFVGSSMQDVTDKVREPFLNYLRTSTDLIDKARWERTAFAKADPNALTTEPTRMSLDELAPEDMDALLDHAYERYFSELGLFGTPADCLPLIARLSEVGVDEIACLIDFGINTETVLAALPWLDRLRDLSNSDGLDDVTAATDYSIGAQIQRHAVTHLQCTPSLLGMLLLDDNTAQAMSQLDQLLIGGEELSTAVLERLRPHFPAVVRNMYGPTETTIWSTSANVRLDSSPTIGKPIANTTIRIADSTFEPLPLGVQGEVLISGEGVARGYLAQAKLTAERFVTDPRTSVRFYRTGDLGRWNQRGELEFLGRLDHQVKIRGHRVELGEIEHVLAAAPAVRETVVVADEGVAGNTRLIAYVTLQSSTDNTLVGATDTWATVWDATYRSAALTDGDLDTAGWTSSFDGERIPEVDMNEWVEETVSRVLALAKTTSATPRLLEIGCGTGMLLVRLARAGVAVSGTDVSSTALERTARRLKAQGLSASVLVQLPAHRTTELSEHGPFDIIVLNSVIQYFPNADYLEQVLAGALSLLSEHGVLFVGDVRNHNLATAFSLGIEFARGDTGTVAELGSRVQRHLQDEVELLAAPEFFEAFALRHPQFSLVSTEVRQGRADTEMSRYRFDAVIRRAPSGAESIDAITCIEATENATLDSMRGQFTTQPWLEFQGVPNARIYTEARIASEFSRWPASATVAQLLAAARSVGPGLHPDDLRQLHPEYVARVEFSATHPACVDVLYAHHSVASSPCWPRRAQRLPSDAATHTNIPKAQSRVSADISGLLREHCRNHLPEFMVPSVFIVLDALPLTPNGKIDRKQLPRPDQVQARRAAAKPPSNDIEAAIIATLQELIGSIDIGIDDNFFDAGANSLLMVQASVRLRERLGRPVPLLALFQNPTANALARALAPKSSASAISSDVAEVTTQRAQQRRAALQRRRPGRTEP